MALQIKHKITPNNSNRNIVLTETTGVYSSTNPGGYGSTQVPAPYRETTDVDTSVLQLLNYNGTVNFTGTSTATVVDGIYSVNYLTVDATAIAAGTSKTIDLGTLIPNTYIDAVYKSYYYNWFHGQFTILNNSTTSITVGDIQEFVNASYIKIAYDSGLIEIFEIVSLNTSTGELVLNGTVETIGPLTTYLVGYSSIAYFANTYSINKCLHSRISKLAISSCTCNNGCTEKLYEAVMLYMAIQPNMDLGKYQKAQDIIEYLTNYCNDGCCNC